MSFDDLIEIVPQIEGIQNATITRLVARNCSHSIEEGLQSKVKDPLWFAGRQWQLGEFRAYNGGNPIRDEVSSSSRMMDHMRPAGSQTYDPIDDIELPLEAEVENIPAAMPEGVPYIGAWNTQRLEYEFDIKGGDAELTSKEYFSGHLDWFDFNVKKDTFTDGKTETVKLLPSSVQFRGMPDASWWKIEDGQVDLGGIQRPNLNFLNMMLVEYTNSYFNDWFIIPMPQQVGTLRSINSVKVWNSFGACTTIRPIEDNSADQTNWSIFSLAKNDTTALAESARLFYLPNALTHAYISDPIEEVTFARDEGANLVWAIEHKYQDGAEIVNRDNEESGLTPDDPAPQNGKPLYRLRSFVPRHWIPFIARRAEKYSEALILRRSRTDVNASKANPQYKGKILSESVTLFEEEVPALPFKVVRCNKMSGVGKEKWSVKQDNGAWKLKRENTQHSVAWQGREKKVTDLHTDSRLKFDYIVEK
jgi:hypothetical protein